MPPEPKNPRIWEPVIQIQFNPICQFLWYMVDMEEKTGAGSGGWRLIAAGFAGIAILFVAYSRYQDPELLTPGSLEPLVRLAYAFYVLLLLALGAIAYGAHSYQEQRIRRNDGGLATIIALATRSPRSRRIWAGTFVAYGLFFSLSSGVLVYQPDVVFSEAYGADIPSGFISPCCGSPGYMPVVIVYMTEHVGLQIVPVNLVLQLAVSYLVALNVSLAVAAISLSKKSRSVGTVGAATGLFIACPTCAGTFLSLFLGTASGLGAAFVITQLQTLFIAVTIPVLLATPLVIARKLRNADGGCRLDDP